MEMRFRAHAFPGLSVVASLALCLLAACSGGSGSPAADAGDLGTTDDAARTSPVLPDQGAGEESLGGDDGGGDLAVDAAPDCQSAPGGAGCSCSSNGDCDSDWCVWHMGTMVCTVECVEECPEGFSCGEMAGLGADKVYACVSKFPGLCLPCAASSECPSPIDRCVVYPDGLGAFCGGACSEEVPCPEGYDCADVPAVEGNKVTRCVAAAGECSCTGPAVQAGMTTPCSVSAEAGTCTGWRTCTADGLTPCDAPTPAQEVCGNDADEDCDGLKDDPDVCIVCSCDTEDGKKDCGDDGCGGSCGDCAPNHVCKVDGKCVCVPDCSGKTCGDDGCSGTCGQCGPATKCLFGNCQPGCETDAGCPDLQECVEGYCQPDLPDDAVLMEPLAAETVPGVPTQVLRAKVFEPGTTEDAGPAPGIAAELGAGPAGSNPQMPGSGWKWGPATYDKDDAGHDVWKGTLAPAAAGAFSFTFRFSVDGLHWVFADSTGLADGFDAASTGKLVALKAPEISGLLPSHGSVLGGDQVTVQGSDFKAGLKLHLDGQQVPVAKVTETTVTFVTPPHPAGAVTVEVENPSGQKAGKKSAFHFVLRFTPTLDGSLAEWALALKVGKNGLASNWDPALNSVEELYAAYDADYLYVAVKGFCESKNYLVGYVDADFPAASGTADMIWLSDNSGDGDLDDALSNILEVTVPGFGGEYGFGSRGMASYTMGGNLADSKFTGWRELGPPYNLAWVQGTVACSSSGLEAALPLATLYKGTPPAGGSQIALFVRLTDRYGDKPGLSNQALPEYFSFDSPEEVGAVAVFALIP